MAGPLESHSWPKPHAVDDREAEYLNIALAEDDWSHTSLCELFEQRIAEYLGSRHALLVPSGTAAVYLALLAAGIEPGQEVILPGMTWPSVVYAIVKAGGVPRPIDISPKSLCIEAGTIEEAISERTFAILPTHLFGSQCDMGPIVDLAHRYRVQVIEDAAQSVGSSQDGKRCGTWGVAGAFSLNDKKVLACGEGGFVTTDSEAVFAELKRLQLILPERVDLPRTLPGTYKVSEFQAAVALGQLEKLEGRLSRMQQNARALSQLLESEPRQQVVPQAQPAGVDVQSHYNYCFLLRAPVDAQDFRRRLSASLNMKVSTTYRPLSQITDFTPYEADAALSGKELLRRSLPNCDHAFQHSCVRLPFFSLLAEPEIIPTIASEILRCVDDAAQVSP